MYSLFCLKNEDSLVQRKNIPGTTFHSRGKWSLASRDRPILSTYKNVIYLLFLHKIQLQKNKKDLQIAFISQNHRSIKLYQIRKIEAFCKIKSYANSALQLRYITPGEPQEYSLQIIRKKFKYMHYFLFLLQLCIFIKRFFFFELSAAAVQEIKIILPISIY